MLLSLSVLYSSLQGFVTSYSELVDCWGEEAKVTSAESLASSFMASSRTSILCDWILSISWRAALDWEGGMMLLQTGD